MYYNRIDPKTGLARIFNDFEDRLGTVETAPSGPIGTTEQFIVVNPDTGQEIIIGTLPDGSFDIGIDLTDTTPPEAPSAPVVKASLGGVTVTWNGLDYLGAAQPNDFVKCVIEYSTNDLSWAVGGVFRDAGSYLVSGLTVGTSYTFRLKSYDRNGNVSLPSSTSSATPEALTTPPDIQQAINELKAADTAMKSTLDGKVTVSANPPTVSDLLGKPTNALWTQVVGGKQVGAWYKPAIDSTAWVPIPFDPVMIPQINIGTGTFGELDGIRLKAGTVTAKQMLITDYQNLVDNPRFNQTLPLTGWTNATGAGLWSETAFTGVPSKRAATAVVGTAVKILQQDRKVDVKPLEKFRISFYVSRSDASPTPLTVALRFVSSTNTAVVGGVMLLTPNMVASNTTYYQEYVVTAPANSTFVNISVQTNATASPTGSVYISEIEIFRMNAGKLIVDGEIKAVMIDTEEFFATTAVIDKLNARVATFLTNTDGSGYTSTVTGQGLKVSYNEIDAVDGLVEVQDVIKLGTFDSDFFSISSGGSTLASINSQGAITGQSLNIAGDVMIAGNSFSSYLNKSSNSTVAYGSASFGGSAGGTNVKVGSNSQYGIISANLVTPGNRLYRLTFETPTFVFSQSDRELRVFFRVRYTDENDTSNITIANSSVFSTYWLGSENQGTWRRDSITALCAVPEAQAGKQVQFLVSMDQGPDSSTGYVRIFDVTRLDVADSGEIPFDTVVTANTGGGKQFDGDPVAPAPAPTPPPPAKVTRTWEAAYTVGRSYTGNNAFYNYNTSRGYQGLSPAGYGNLKSIWTFPSVTSMLSGATVNEIWAYFYFEHWYYNAGGTARIYVHGHSSVPATYSSTGIVVTSGGWPKGAGRWVKIPSVHYAGFKSGTYKGLALEGDGTYNTYGVANMARLKIVYTK